MPYSTEGLWPPFNVSHSYYTGFFLWATWGVHEESSQHFPSASVPPNHLRVAFWLPMLNYKNTHPHQPCKSLRAKAQTIFPHFSLPSSHAAALVNTALLSWVTPAGF